MVGYYYINGVACCMQNSHANLLKTELKKKKKIIIAHVQHTLIQ